MAGVRIGGSAVLVVCSPPVSALEGAAYDFDPQIYRSCSGDAAGEMTIYTTFSGGGTVLDQCHNPVLSPDQTQILFEGSSATTGFTEIWVVDNVPGSTATQLIADASNYLYDPFWSSDSDTFVYVKGAAGARSGGTIYKDQVSAIGSPTSLKTAAGGFSPVRPQFNFDGTRVAYIFDKDVGTGGDFRVMNDDGTGDSSLDNTISGYRGTIGPPQYGWGTETNQLAYEDGAGGSNAAYIIQDNGTGKTQLNSAGAGAGADARMSSLCFAASDAWVVYTSSIGGGFRSCMRAELNGSNTTQLNASHGASVQSFMQQALMFQNRIWFIEVASGANNGKLSYILPDGTGYQNTFDANAGTGDQVSWFSGGDGFYFT